MYNLLMNLTKKPSVKDLGINVLQAGKKGLQVKLLQQILHKEADNNHLVNLQRLFCLIIKAIIIILVK